MCSFECQVDQVNTDFVDLSACRALCSGFYFRIRFLILTNSTLIKFRILWLQGYSDLVSGFDVWVHFPEVVDVHTDYEEYRKRRCESFHYACGPALDEAGGQSEVPPTAPATSADEYMIAVIWSFPVPAKFWKISCNSNPPCSSFP